MSITGIIEPTTSLKNARIGYKNLLVSSNSAESDLSLTPNTYERWRESGSMSATFEFSSSSTIDFIGVAAHNLFTSGATLIRFNTAEIIGGPYTLQADIPITSNSAIMHVLDSPIDNIIEVVINITSSGGFSKEIGVIYVGQSLEMQQPIYGGHSPIALSAETEYQSTMSESGNFIGRTITSQGTESNFSWQHLTPSFYRDEFELFVQSAKTLPFFLKWRPDLFDETVFGFTTADIKPQNMGGGHQLMSVNFNMRGHSD